MMQGAICNPQIAGTNCLRFPTLLHQLHGFQLEFLRKRVLFVIDDP